MEYLVLRRFRGVCLGGRVNLPAGTACICREGVIYWGEKPVCLVASDVAHRFFAPNFDGQGWRRGQLIGQILRLVRRDKRRAVRLLLDPVACRYRRAEHRDTFLWSHGFYVAPVEELEHILHLLERT